MKDLSFIMPEIFLALTLAAVIAAEVTYFGEQTRLIMGTALLGLATSFVQTLFCYKYGSAQIFNGMLSIDGFSLFFKLFFILLAILCIASLTHNKEIAAERRTEFCALVLASTLAMCLVASVADLILAFLSLLFLNVMSYFLAAYGKRSVLSTEAAVKAFAYGTVSSALFLYSLSILFAYTHSLNIYEIHRFLMNSPLPPNVMLIVFMLSFLALCFQMGIFPMYFFMPDMIEGSPTPVSSYLSLGTRAAGFVFSIRFVTVIFAQATSSPGQWQVLGGFDWTAVLSTLASLSMMIGSLLAYRQKAIKRMVGYLIVSQSGFLLIGILVLDEVGLTALLYNLVVELFSLMGIFYVVSFFIDQLNSDRFEDMKGILKRALPESICLILFLLCFVGSPPLPGFIGKFTLLGSAFRHSKPVLASIGIISMVISIVTVIRLSFYLIGNIREKNHPVLKNYSRIAFLGVLAVPLVLAGVFPDLIFKWAGQSLGFIFW